MDRNQSLETLLLSDKGMNKLLLSIWVMLCFMLHAKSQQRVQFSQYMNNLYMINPAAGGTDDYGDIKVSYRSQWIGLPGAPTSYYVSGHVPLEKIAGSGRSVNYKKNYNTAGGYICNDKTGPTSRLNMVGSYAYNMKVSDNFRVSSGIFLGIQQYTLHGESLTFHDPGDNSTLQRVIVPDITIGMMGYSKKVYFGISMSQVFQNKLNFDYSAISSERDKYSKLSNHYYITSGVKINVNDDFTLIPSLLIKYVSPAIPSIDINAKLKYKKMFWVGASYRNLDSFIGMVGANINQIFVLAYSYDASISGLSTYNAGSHEILLGVKLQGKRKYLLQKYFW